MTSPDLRRKVRATQARQGGFSAHTLPAPVVYDPAFEYFEFRPTLLDGKYLITGPGLGTGRELTDRQLDGVTSSAIVDGAYRITSSGAVGASGGVGVLTETPEQILEFATEPNAPVTVEAWLSAPNVDDQWSIAWLDSTALGPFAPTAGLLALRTAGGLRINAFKSFSGLTPDLIAPYSSGEIHIRAVYNGSSVQIAVNGSQIGSDTNNTPWDFSTLKSFRCLYIVHGQPSEVSVRLVRLYQVALRSDNFTPPQE
jgi:hypothetical protein